MKNLKFLTSNQFKIATARIAFEPYGIEVDPIKLDIPEIQASNMEIAFYGAKTAAQMLNEPIIREDHGFYLDAFPGWPGPYMTYTESIIPPKDLLKLLTDKEKTGYFEMALAYVDPIKGKTFQFSFQVPVTVLDEIRSGNMDFGWDSILSIGNKDLALSEYPQEDRYSLFINNFVSLAERLSEI